MSIDSSIDFSKESDVNIRFCDILQNTMRTSIVLKLFKIITFREVKRVFQNEFK